MKTPVKGSWAFVTLVAAMCIALSSVAQQLPRNVEISDLPVLGSKPYQQTVSRYIKKEKPKVVGGTLAATGAYPWQVSLGVSWIASSFDAHFCGGSIYNETWIVTAAHCLENTAPKDVVVTAGTNVLGVGGSRHNVNRVIVKRDYVSATYENDVALIELIEPLSFGPAIKPVTLLTTPEEKALLLKDTALVVVGWGATQEGGQSVRDLRFVTVPFVERATCNRPLAYEGRVTANMICAGVSSGGADSCQGDSGGPLTVATSTAPRLAGIVSWGDGCAVPNRVGVYARVAGYTNWIESCVASPRTCQ